MNPPFPQDGQPTAIDAAGAAVRQADALLEIRRTPEAVDLLRRALATSPESSALHAALGKCLYAAGEWPDALTEAEAAIGLSPEDEWPHRLRALILLALGRKHEGLKAATTAVQLSPESPNPLLVLADAEVACKRIRSAEATTARLVQLDPELADAHDARGRVLLRQRRYREAEASFREALRLDPLGQIYMTNLGVALQRLRRHEEAVQAFGAAATMEPDEALLRHNVAVGAVGWANPLGGLPRPVQLLALLLIPVLIIWNPYLAIAVLLVGIYLYRRRVRAMHPAVQYAMAERQKNGPNPPFVMVAALGLFALVLIAVPALMTHSLSVGIWLAVMLLGPGVVIALVRRRRGVGRTGTRWW